MRSDWDPYISATAAQYESTKINTTAYRVPNTWIYNPNLPAGAPCSTLPSSVTIYAYTVLTTTVQAMGNYRKCV